MTVGPQCDQYRPNSDRVTTYKRHNNIKIQKIYQNMFRVFVEIISLYSKSGFTGGVFLTNQLASVLTHMQNKKNNPHNK